VSTGGRLVTTSQTSHNAGTTQLPASVVIRDCSVRDGLQPLDPVAPSQRVALVEALFAAGVCDVEVGAFVSPKAVPAMAGAAEVVAGVPPMDGRRRWVLVPNLRGAQMATDAGVGHLTVTVSASPAYSAKNVGMSVADSIAEVARIRAAAPDAVVDVVVSCAFGSPFDDDADDADVTVASVAEVCAAVVALGVDQITLADTTGMATPRRVAEVVGAVRNATPGGPSGAPTGAPTGALSGAPTGELGLHLHDTRGTALVNAWAAMALGVRRFDTSLGGLGGSPFAPGAGGNLATEDLVLVLDDMGITTGVSLDGLLAAGTQLAAVIGRALPSRVAAAGGIGTFG
jgi:hydroxymethylglutaryl-CoA lyase